MTHSPERTVYSSPASLPDPQIELFAADRRRIGAFSEADLKRMPGVEITRNRKGRAVRAQMRGISLHVRAVLSSRGMSFQQEVASGRVWALRGVRGSERA